MSFFSNLCILLAFAVFCSGGVAAVGGEAVPLFRAKAGDGTKIILPRGAQPPVIPGGNVGKVSTASLTPGMYLGTRICVFQMSLPLL
jgi:hypothetical protein